MSHEEAEQITEAARQVAKVYFFNHIYLFMGERFSLSIEQVEEAGRGGIDDLEATLHRLVELVHPRHYLAMQVSEKERCRNDEPASCTR